MKFTVKKYSLILCLFAIFFVFLPTINVANAYQSMPFYNLKPKEIVFRSSFYTSYYNSSEERKSNISLACKSLDNTIVDVNGEFSFNNTVGERTEKRGYKKAKIIVGGEFVDGVGGGVCQVSTTLYNAVLLSGLKVIEYHPHSLPVSYVAPSFDAMVNSSYADLRFVNNTNNPIIIKAYADGSKLKIEIYGEEMKEKYERESQITQTITSPGYIYKVDYENNYPELKRGEQKIISYAKDGYYSNGVLIKKVNGKVVSRKKIRNDRYLAVRGVVIEGTTMIEEENIATENPN